MKFDNLKIRTKLIIIYIACVLLPLSATNFFVFRLIKQSVEADQLRGLADMCGRIEFEISEKINTAVSISNYLYTDRSLNTFISREYESPVEYYENFNRLMQDNVIRYYYTAQSVYGVSVCTDNETITRGSYFTQLSYIRDTKWYQAYKRADTNLLLYVYYEEENPYTKQIGRARNISIIKKLVGTNGENLLKLDIDYLALMHSIVNENSNADIYIHDGSKIIYSTINSEDIYGDFQPISTIVEKGIVHLKEISIQGQKWYIYITQNQHSIISALRGQASIVILLMFLNLILPSFVITLIDKSFRGRITLTEQYIKKVEKGEFEGIVCHEGSDEIGNLIRSYNLMVAKIKELVEVVYKKNAEKQDLEISKKQAELNALQSQVNPHFLFNTLESIRMRSFIKRERETADVLEKLAALMRRIIEWNKDFVTIEEEVCYIRNYLDIQIYRFGQRLNYSIDIQEECLSRKIPKFGILTFVENACVHGIENRIEGGSITLIISMDSTNIILEVSDSGGGISEFELLKLREKIDKASIEDLKSSKSIGILNTIVRLKLYYGEGVELTVHSKSREGTQICLKLPIAYNPNLKDC